VINGGRKREWSADLAPPKEILSKDAIPKGVARVLNAAQIRAEWREKNKNKKRQLEEDPSSHSNLPRNKKRMRLGGEGDERGGRRESEQTTALQIQSGESLSHFNRRVEDSLRGSIRSAVKSSAVKQREARKEKELTNKSNKSSKSFPSHPSQSSTGKPAGRAEDSTTTTHTDKTAKQRAVDFTSISTSAPRRLNDIVQAPPDLKTLPRGAKKVSQVTKPTPSGSLRDGVLSMAQRAMLDEERERVIKLYREMKKKRIEG